MLRMCVLTVFGETDSSPAISAGASVQDPGRLAQQQPDVRPGVCLYRPYRALEPPLALIELPQPHHRAGQRHQRGRDHWFRAPAVPLGERDDRHLPGRRPIQGSQKITAVNQPGSRSSHRHGPALISTPDTLTSGLSRSRFRRGGADPWTRTMRTWERAAGSSESDGP
jgi:hypothetical protein